MYKTPMAKLGPQRAASASVALAEARYAAEMVRFGKSIARDARSALRDWPDDTCIAAAAANALEASSSLDAGTLREAAMCLLEAVANTGKPKAA